MIIYSSFICSPLHSPICWDIAMGFSSQQLAGLVPGEQPWSGCPCFSASEKTWVIFEDPVCLPLSCSWLWLSRCWAWPTTSFYCVTAADASLPAAASTAFAGCLPSLMAPAVLAGVTQHKGFLNTQST